MVNGNVIKTVMLTRFYEKKLKKISLCFMEIFKTVE